MEAAVEATMVLAEYRAGRATAAAPMEIWRTEVPSRPRRRPQRVLARPPSPNCPPAACALQGCGPCIRVSLDHQPPGSLRWCYLELIGLAELRQPACKGSGVVRLTGADLRGRQVAEAFFVRHPRHPRAFGRGGCWAGRAERGGGRTGPSRSLLRSTIMLILAGPCRATQTVETCSKTPACGPTEGWSWCWCQYGAGRSPVQKRQHSKDTYKALACTRHESERVSGGPFWRAI